MRAFQWWIFCGISLFAWTAFLYRIDSQSIWFDEGWSAYAAVQPTLWAAIEADPTNPPLYYLLLNITTRGFGNSAFSLRITSALIGLLVIALAFQLGRRLFNRRVGLFAALLVGCSPLLWWAAQEARMYTLLAALVLIAALTWHTILYTPSRRAWLILLAAELLLLYAHNTGPVIVLWLNAITLLYWLTRRSLKQPDWRAWIAGQVIVGLLWLPFFLTRFIHVQAANSAITSSPQIGPDLISRIWQAFWIAPWEMIGREPVTIGFAAVITVIALLIVPIRQVNARWLIIHVLLLIAGLIVGLTVIGNEIHGRYTVMVAPLLLVALGAGIARLRWPILRYGISGLLALLFLHNIIVAQNPLYQHDNARGMVQHYAETLKAEDTVLAWSYADRYDLAYYWDRLGVVAQRVTLPEGADWPHVAPLLPDTGRVALNQWFTQRADYRGMLPCILEAGSINAPDSFTTYGMTSLLYESPAAAVPEMRSINRPVLRSGTTIATVTGVGLFPAMTADRALCVPVELRVEQALAVDLRAAVIIRNDLGWDIAQASAVFATANQRTTTAVQSGESVTAYALLRLPYGAPPGDYDMLLRVFDDSAAPSGYEMSAEDGRIIGNDLPLGTWRVQPGADWSWVTRETHLPYRVYMPLEVDTVLLAHNIAPTMTVQPGQILRIELLWQNADDLPILLLTNETTESRTSIPPQTSPRDAITLDWRQTTIDRNAAGGTLGLFLQDGTWLGDFVIDALPRLDDAPEVDILVNRALGDVGLLVGYSASAETDRTQPFPVTLIWRASDAQIEANYTVFVQLLDSQGRLIAQSDSVPNQGQRPTTGWRAGEYVIDAHHLTFNDTAAPGDAHLIAGMYDPLTGQRVLMTPDGPDFIDLPGILSVR